MLLELLERIFPRTNSSRQEVKNRLRLLLAHDRTDLPPHVVESMRKEILEVLSRYVELDMEAMEFSLESDQRSSVLIANFPIRRIYTSVELDKPETADVAIPDLALTDSGDPVAITAEAKKNTPETKDPTDQGLTAFDALPTLADVPLAIAISSESPQTSDPKSETSNPKLDSSKSDSSKPENSKPENSKPENSKTGPSESTKPESVA